MNDLRKKEVAVVITEPGQNIALLSRDLLRSLGLDEVIVTNSTADTIQLVNRGVAQLVVIDDTADYPAPIIHRNLHRNALLPITPTIILLGDQYKHETNALATLGRPMIVHKPLTPGRIAPGLRTLNNVWNNGAFVKIKQARQLICRELLDQAMQILTELTRHPKTQAVIAPTVAMLLRESQNLQVAEKVLLASLKRSPRDLGVIFALSDLYLHAAMPATALRLMKGVDAINGNSMMTCTDKLQAYHMMGNLESSIELIENMQSRNFDSLLHDFLLRMLYSEGNVEKFQNRVRSEAKAQRFSLAWGNNPAPNLTGKAS